MKWAGIYLVGSIFLIGGILAALWQLGILASTGATWTLIGVVIAVGIGIMVSVSNSGSKEDIQIDRQGAARAHCPRFFLLAPPRPRKRAREKTNAHYRVLKNVSWFLFLAA